MRAFLIDFLKQHNTILDFFYLFFRFVLNAGRRFFKMKPKQILIASFGGRGFNDSPKILYQEICNNSFFDDYKIIWAFTDPDKFDIPRGEKVKIDSREFYRALITSGIWISNTGADRGIGINKKDIIDIETWHGTPLKKIGCDQNTGSIATKHSRMDYDTETIRCAQSEFDRNILAHVDNADKECYLLCDLPRNDILAKASNSENLVPYTVISYKEYLNNIRKSLSLPEGKKIILYMPTYREFETDSYGHTFLEIPMNLDKWNDRLGNDYILLIRAHYAVYNALKIKESKFAINVSNYPDVNDLYLISDLMITDYSSSYFDYSILCRPMFCFAYDLEEYTEKRGFYIDIYNELPCRINKTEEELLDDILSMNYEEAVERARLFHLKYSPNAGLAAKVLVNALMDKIQKEN